MIDTDAYEKLLEHYMQHDDLWELAAELLTEVKRLQSEPTVTVDDYHKKGNLYVTVSFPDGVEYAGLVEKQEGEEE